MVVLNRIYFFIIFVTVKNALKYGFVLVLSFGLFLLTTGNETCFNSADNHFISHILDDETDGGDADNSHSFQHLSEDLFAPVDCPKYINEGISVAVIILAPVRINNNFFTSIWQPPKFS